jgi:hypothetical protein
MSAAGYERLALERRCAHCERDADGGLYPGRAYLRALQRHRGDEAVRLARHVEPFFWGDADIIRVRLCRPCAEELGIEESPRDGGGEEAPRASPPERGRRRVAGRGRRQIDRQSVRRMKTRVGLPRLPPRHPATRRAALLARPALRVEGRSNK